MSKGFNIKESLRQLADQLPEDAIWEDVIQEARIRQGIEQGLKEADAGHFASDEEVRSTFARWSVDIDSVPSKTHTSWDSFFSAEDGVTDDFMANRSQGRQQEREEFND